MSGFEVGQKCAEFHFNMEAGTIHSAQSVYTEYPDPHRDEWQGKVLPALRKFPVHVLMKLTNKSRSMLERTLAGRTRPRVRNQVLLKSALRKIGALGRFFGSSTANAVVLEGFLCLVKHPVN